MKHFAIRGTKKICDSEDSESEVCTADKTRATCPACMVRLGIPVLQTTGNRVLAPALKGDCGYDLVVSEWVTILPKNRPIRNTLWKIGRGIRRHPSGKLRLRHRVSSGFAKVPSGNPIAIPEGHWGLIVPRSSVNITGRLLVLPGVIDAYRGPLFAFVHNIGNEPVTLAPGDRVAQLVLIPTSVFPILITPDLPSSERGERGFGSTGGNGHDN